MIGALVERIYIIAIAIHNLKVGLNRKSRKIVAALK